MDKLRAALAWLKSCPVWQKPQAAEAALEKALAVLESMDKRLTALEGGNDGKTESR